MCGTGGLSSCCEELFCERSAPEPWHSYRHHLVLHNDRISLRETWLSLPFTLRVFPLLVLPSCLLPQQILNFPSNLFTHFDKPKNSLELPYPTTNIRKCSKLINDRYFWQSKQDIICHEAKVKPAMSAHYVADIIAFLAYLKSPSNPMLR